MIYCNYNKSCDNINNCCNINYDCNPCCTPCYIPNYPCTPSYCCNPCCSCTIPNATPSEPNLNDVEKEICNICQNQYDYFLQKPHVVGLGMGFKSICNEIIPMDSIVVYVDKKVGLNTLPPSAIIPPMYNNIPTDVVETGGAFEVFRSLKDRIRPAIGGCSIGPSIRRGSGTLGCLVRDANGLYILSNNHVLASFNQNPIGTPICQPGLSDGGTTPNDIIATLDRFVPVMFATPTTQPKNFVDCAIAKVTNPSLVSPVIASINRPPQGVIPPTLNIGVKKVGKVTGLTSGIVRSLSTTFITGGLLFVNQIVATVMSQPGDSGALVLDANDRAMALLTGGTPENYSSMCPIMRVLSDLNVSLVTS